jgi:hypothetical protein
VPPGVALFEEDISSQCVQSRGLVKCVPCASKTLAVFAIVVEAKNARAVAFYEGFGFRRFPLHPDRLFLLTSSAVAAVERM